MVLILQADLSSIHLNMDKDSEDLGKKIEKNDFRLNHVV